ncbi:MAG: MATE family efflux transporter [Culicoidibacterales bacterium]
MMPKNDLTTGPIGPILLTLAVPIVISNFIQTASGMVNMIWVGKLGSDAVAAIGTAGFFINLAIAFSTLIIIGAGVRIAQSIGAKNQTEAFSYTKNSIILTIIISLVFSVIIGICSPMLIRFFEMNNPAVEQMAVEYLVWSLTGVPFLFLSTLFTTILTSYGDTKLGFKINTIGFLLNIILDPLFIFGFALIPRFGIMGAAIATTISRIITTVLFIIFGRKYSAFPQGVKVNFAKMREIINISFPVTLQRVIFIFISIYMAKIIVQFGTNAIAVQKIGIQIEALTYMTIGGIQGAIAAFVGQNHGANQNQRIIKGYGLALKLVTVFGCLITGLFFFFPQQLFSIFISDPLVISGGVGYMITLAISQVFMCWELLTVGAFNGLGKTHAPPIVSIIFSLLRIPLAIFLAQYFGLIGVWMSISVTSVIKGIILVGWFNYIEIKQLK